MGASEAQFQILKGIIGQILALKLGKLGRFKS